MKPTMILLLGLACCLTLSPLAAAELQPIPLPKPQTDRGRPLMQVLKERKTTREFSTNSLPLQVLADLLWAGFGTNRVDGHRTAPSAMNSQEIEIYIALPEGSYVYEAHEHRLRPVAPGDVRAKTGGQDFVKAAPLALIFVADLSRLAKAKPEDRERYAAIDTGYISQNIYLFCASAGLATVVHELGRQELPDLLKLKPEQKIILAQSVGFPK
jgi:SagB-type dehydrogenase family enzyme